MKTILIIGVILFIIYKLFFSQKAMLRKMKKNSERAKHLLWNHLIEILRKKYSLDEANKISIAILMKFLDIKHVSSNVDEYARNNSELINKELLMLRDNKLFSQVLLHTYRTDFLLLGSQKENGEETFEKFNSDRPLIEMFGLSDEPHLLPSQYKALVDNYSNIFEK